ncbi:hypothetical protein GJW-30_1_02246 [Variibacter gotjawalensis]|uniref:BioF2-like acetyltransferase domain-containing protein n=1 Tax=Variibacter gotjawalensis TaxID=1333996 RepID=A0A0S3PUS9_9BRAD|nr:GNAT family N-acetyltransferase [Variibacter gotjawalensis]NIK50039.1 hypothetical protein [Variibacter gotjawalensis]RZS46038.1 acetyltransferase (GNAT) family protein [Variibacter gotjawalensis]BAT59713.1 hypothetical protein GJW-30_1_02246 [Variibacter gotjawalensis]
MSITQSFDRDVKLAKVQASTSAAPSVTVSENSLAAPVLGAGWKVVVVTGRELADQPRWQRAFAEQRKDRRYYEIVENTVEGSFEHRYFVFLDQHGEARAIQPFFLLDQDLLAGVGATIQNAVAKVRRVWPRFMRLRTLMVGCAAGEGHLDATTAGERHAIGAALAGSLRKHARAMKAPIVVLKEFASRYRDALAVLRDNAGFTRVPSLPMTQLRLDFDNFDDYMQKKLSRIARKDLRRKFKAAAKADPIEMTVVRDVSDVIDEIYPLYLNVYERSSLHFEKLTKEYLIELGRRMPDRVRFFLWRQNGKIVAFNLCMVHADAIYDEYIGLDYTVALNLHLYHYTFRDVMNWAIAQGYKRFVSNGLNYDPKLHLRQELAPIDLYVRHTSAIANFGLGIALPLLEPTRYDKTLKKFPNYADLWG